MHITFISKIQDGNLLQHILITFYAFDASTNSINWIFSVRYISGLNTKSTNQRKRKKLTHNDDTRLIIFYVNGKKDMLSDVIKHRNI